MNVMFCWRCQMDIPMLDEEEFAAVRKVHYQCISATKEFRLQHNLPLENCSLEMRFRPLLEKYREITGFEETEKNAIWHHRISRYGPPCKHCQKPLRSPQASYCAACGKAAV